MKQVNVKPYVCGVCILLAGQILMQCRATQGLEQRSGDLEEVRPVEGYMSVPDPGGKYELRLQKTKPSPDNSVPIVHFFVIEKESDKVVYTYNNLRGEVEWASDNLLWIKEIKGILLPDGTNYVTYYLDVTTGKRKPKEKQNTY